MNFYGGGQKSVSGQQLPKSYFPLIRGHSWHKKQTRRIRRGHYRINNFQDSRKLLGYLPTSNFFNAFKLGTRSNKNQIFSNEEALTSNLAFKGGEKRNFSLLIRKCSIPFLNGNDI